MIHQHDDRIVAPRFAVGRAIDLLGISAAALGDDDLAAVEELVADRDRLGEQAAGIAAKIENQALGIVAEALQRVADFAAGRFLEAAQVDIADTRA